MTPGVEAGSVASAIAGAIAAIVALRVAHGVARRLLRSWRTVAERDLFELFIFVEPRYLHAAIATAVFVATVTCAVLHAGVAVTIGLCALVAAAPALAARALRRRRRERIKAQLPDVLALWAGLLQAGRGVMPALGELAANQPDPVGQELRLVLRRCRVGDTIDTAIDGLTRRVPDPDLELLATTLRLSRELGGNLAEALQRLATTIRERLLLEGRIGALTAQGRLQGVILALLPLLLLAILLGMQPGLGHLLRDTPAGWAALGSIAVLETLGYLSIRRIVAIRI